jgi:hypothetical protein
MLTDVFRVGSYGTKYYPHSCCFCSPFLSSSDITLYLSNSFSCPFYSHCSSYLNLCVEYFSDIMLDAREYFVYAIFFLTYIERWFNSKKNTWEMRQSHGWFGVEIRIRLLNGLSITRLVACVRQYFVSHNVLVSAQQCFKTYNALVIA